MTLSELGLWFVAGCAGGLAIAVAATVGLFWVAHRMSKEHRK